MNLLSIWRNNRSSQNRVAAASNRRIKTNPKLVRAAVGRLEMLEDRRLMSLLGVFPNNSIVQFDSTGKMNYVYNSTTQQGDLTVSATPFEFDDESGFPTIKTSSFTGPSNLTIDFKVDSSGNVVGGQTTPNLTVTGTVNDPTTNLPYSGVLLQANIAQFGWDYATNPHNFDFTFTNVTGALASYYSGEDVGIALSSQGNTFAGSFTNNWTGGAPFGAGADGFITDVPLVPSPFGSLSGNVFEDLYLTGQPHSGDVQLPNVTIDLTGNDINGNPVNLITQTSSNGSFEFNNLIASDANGYTLTEVQATVAPPYLIPSIDTAGTLGGNTSVQDVISNIILPSGANGVMYQFTQIPPSQISGYVYNDLNNNGVFESGEPAIPNVSMSLTGTDFRGNAVSLTTTTDSNGFYQFSGLLPSFSNAGYSVTETQPAPYQQGIDTAGSGWLLISPATQTPTSDTYAATPGIPLLPAGDVGTQYNFGEILPLVSINGSDFFVPNSTTPGSLTTSSTGIPIVGTIVVLTGTDYLGNIVNLTTSTNGSGQYSFNGLNPSDASGYTVTETPPATDSHVGQTSNTSGAITTPASTPVVSTIVLTTNGSSSTDNYFETATVSINGTDYLVSNTTPAGSLTPASTGVPIAGTTVVLTGTDEFGNTVSVTTSTNGSGQYSFTGLNPSNTAGYTVTETPPAADNHLGQTSNTAGAISTPAATPVVSTIVLTTNGASSTDNYFEIATVSVNGTDYLVSNTTTAGSLTPSSTGVPISGTTVVLTGTDDFGNAINKTTTTNGSGQYSFTGLNPSNAGGYTVTETPPATDSHLGQTSNTSGAVSTPAATPVVSKIVLTTNGSSSTDNYFEIATVSVNGTDYLVSNTTTAASLTPASTGVPISGTTVVLTGTDDFGNAINKTATTNGSGQYSFTGLNPSNAGGYTVTETPPATDSHLGQTSNTAGAVSTPAATPVVSKIVLTTNGASSTDNYYEIQVVSINGYDYLVPNTTTAGSLTTSTTGTPIAGTTVKLSGTDDFGNVVSATATTNSSGFYSFTGLNPSGAAGYTVTETPPASDTHVGQTSTTAGAVTTPATTPVVSKIALTVNGSFSTDNFFETTVASPSITTTPGGTVQLGDITITGIKYQDLTGSGFSSDDTPLAGVTIDLYSSSNNSNGLQTGSGGDKLVGSTVTGSNGAYSFTVASAGTYFVTEVVPSGYIQTGGGPNGSAGCTYYTITATSNHTYGGNNFDDFMIPTCTPTCVYYKVTTPSGHSTTVTELSGNTQQGDTVTAYFTVPSGMNDTLTLVSYEAPTATWSDSNAYEQTIYQVATGTFAPGQHSLTVKIPNSYYQIDFVCGQAINELEPNQNGNAYGPDSSNILYHAEGRFISSDNGGTKYVSLPTPPNPNVPTPTVTSSSTGVLSDSATLSGGMNLTGTITFSLYNPSDAVVYTDVVTITGNGTYTTSMGNHAGGYVPTTTGTYEWVVVYSGDTINKGVTSPYGSEPECVTSPVVCGSTGSCDFWCGQNGQKLINCLNGGSSSCNLGNWLCSNYGNLYGSNCGSNYLHGKSNSYICQYITKLCGSTSTKCNAEALACAINCYVTNSSLCGTSACNYGFTVCSAGCGTLTCNIGTQLANCGGPQGVCSVQSLIQWANSCSSNGNFCGGDSNKQNACGSIFNGINCAGGLC